ncbi:hypothetical protein ANCCAN_15687 [Ancylostoma caninum]|uniref:Uncharacterized protein n=1 Tax=Ancylostoma caninum TaxID=29170 RepID=A0A368G5V9_ANCCA|nr:hypothetical protein ANCCAN_15687 [Ancylostoma caninum]
MRIATFFTMRSIKLLNVIRLLYCQTYVYLVIWNLNSSENRILIVMEYVKFNHSDPSWNKC